MVKIGPAFFDYVSGGKIKRAKDFSYFASREYLALFSLLLLILAFSVIVLRLFYVQVLRGEYYSRLSDENRIREEIIPAPRGIILDRQGRALVLNSPSFRIVENGKIKRLSRDEALERIARGEKVENDVEREYLYKEDFAHVLGYVGQISEKEAILPGFGEHGINDWVGKMGLEEEYEALLHGKNGKKLHEVDSKGQFVRELGKQEPVLGQNLKTTLDLDVQLSVGAAASDIEKGAIIVSDPRNGAILALDSKPAFDPNIFTYPEGYESAGKYQMREDVLSDSEKEPLLNRAIAGLYPPGSTFKLITAVAALERGAIKPQTQIEDTGILRVGDFSFGNWYFLQYGKTEGSLNVVGAIRRSNDIFFYKTAEATGVENISNFSRDFGLGKKFGIDLPGEEEGLVPSPSWKQDYIGEQWYLGDTYNYGIGQGYLLTTPLQVNVFTSVFANGGTIFAPHLIEGKNKVLKKNFIRKDYIDIVRDGMMQSCETGGVAWPFFQFKVKSEKLKVDGRDYIREASDSANTVRIKVACKTGTAEVSDKDKKPHAWITLFAPFYKPEIVVTVLVENGGEGSSVAGPIAKKILEGYFKGK